MCEIFNCNSKSDIFLFMLIKTEDWAQMINDTYENLKIVMSVFSAINLLGDFVLFWDGLSDMVHISLRDPPNNYGEHF